jgi:hypothetical protein
MGQFAYGFIGWTVVAGDWDGNGTWTPAVFDPLTANWYMRNSNSAGAPDVGKFAYGYGTWQPVAGPWSMSGRLLAADQGTGAEALSAEALQATVAAALERLAQAGVNAEVLDRLASTRFAVGTLPGFTLGLADLAANQVTISANAAGHGWFIDPTPGSDEEFQGGSPLGVLPGSPAEGKEDLLTAVLHEMGHLVGQEDLPGSQEANLMTDVLPVWVRRVQSLDAIFSGG